MEMEFVRKEFAIVMKVSEEMLAKKKYVSTTVVMETVHAKKENVFAI